MPGWLSSHYNELHLPVAKLFCLQDQEMPEIVSFVMQWAH